MRNMVNPKQIRLFDPYDSYLTPKTRKRLLDGWAGVFRHVILEILPAKNIAEHFSPTMGRPTKELYSMAGLVLIADFNNWTKQQAADAYSFNAMVQYALNLDPTAHDFCERSFERYVELFEEDEQAKSVMDEVTGELVRLLGIKIDQQRLDSTHICSNMASFGRTRLMGVAVKRFLTQLKRHDVEAYESLDEKLRSRYVPSQAQMFAGTKKDAKSFSKLRQTVAEDMHSLVKRFHGNVSHNNRDTYKALERIFYEQCEVTENRIKVKTKTGCDVMQNPSDPDATYDGHKGPGYQVQLSETCNSENEVQLITSAIPQTACRSDGGSVGEVLGDLENNNLLPDTMLADTAYCGDDNVQLAESKNVELVGPVAGNSDYDDEKLSVDDFDIDETSEEVRRCANGCEPESSEHNVETGKTKTVMKNSDCAGCEFAGLCPVKKIAGRYVLVHTPKQRRLAARRKEEATEIFPERYKIRGGIEATNSGVKRKTGLGQLRVRGAPAVHTAIYMKVTGWNILRASCCAKMREIVYARAAAAVSQAVFAIFDAVTAVIAVKTVTAVEKTQILKFLKQNEILPTFKLAG